MKYHQLNLSKAFKLVKAMNSIIGIIIASCLFSQAPVKAALEISPLTNQSNQISQTSSGTGFGGDRRPGRQTSGDSRGYCVATGSPVLTGLVPDSNIGTTVEPNPTLWFYVPDTPEAAVNGYFTLQDADGNDVIDEIEFSFPNRAGYVSVNLPPDFALDINVEYQWNFELECSPSEPTIYVQGWIKRIPLEPSLESQLVVPMSEHYTVYAENYIWFDTINNLVNQRLANPNNPVLIEDWNSLLMQGGGNLSNLPEQPILGDITELP